MKKLFRPEVKPRNFDLEIQYFTICEINAQINNKINIQWCTVYYYISTDIIFKEFIISY